MVLGLKLLLLITNFSILTYVLMLVIHHYQSNYDKKSWAFLFHILTFLWLVFRGLFWLSTLTSLMKWSSAIFFVLYWMPTPLEFGAFMLLPLYFAQILYPIEWKKYWTYVRPIYFGLTIGIFLFQSIWSYFKPPPTQDDHLHCENVVDDYIAEKCFRTEGSTNAFREITAICFLFLAFIQCWFGIQILKMDKYRYEQYFITSPEILSIVNILLVISFTSRSFYQIMAINQLLILPDIPLQPYDGDVQIAIFVACELWIYIPTLLILLTFTSRTMGNILPSSKREGFYYHRMQNYGSTDLTDDELDYESLLREVPSRQGSFFKSKNSERIPIKVGSLAEGGEGVIPSSFSRAQSWLSEPSRPTSLDAKSGSVGKEGISLLTHYKKFRQRGFSAGSDASSVEGATPLTVNTAVDHKRLAHIPAGKKSVGKPSGKSSRRKIRYYDEKNSVQSNLSHLTTQSLTENESDGSSGRNTANIMKLSGEDDDHEENDEEDEMIVDTTHVPSYGTQISTDMGKQYELMVEPQSPSPPSSYIQESEYLSQRKESFHGIDMIRISSYEATGGDHVHGNHVLFASGAQTPPALLNAHQREPSYYLEENSPVLLSYHHNRNDGGKERKQDIASLALNPVYPRPTRHHPNSNPFHPMAVNSKNYDRSSSELSSSFSPSLMERTRSVDNTSTPDRDEAAKEATMLRQGMTGNRYSPR